MNDPVNFELVDHIPENTEQVLVPVFESDDIKTNWLSAAEHRGFKGKNREVFRAYLSEMQQQITLLGIGGENQLPQAYKVFCYLIINYRSSFASNLAVDLRHLPVSLVYHGVLGISLSDYSVGVYKTKSDEKIPLQNVQLIVSKINEDARARILEAQTTAEVVKSACALVDAPGNIKTPKYLGQWVVDSGQQYGYEVEVLDKNALNRENLHALLAVGQGSVHSPILIKAVYRYTESSDSFDLGLVGKGVTFDTGGISIKKAANMHYMKSDMGGAAAVMGAMELIARLKLPLNAVAVIPVAENSVDASSIRPGDVIQSHAGKSIEVIDTDAEGRLILADALSYIQENYKPKTLIDLATLTGNCVVALGYEAAGLFTKDDELAAAISMAGERSGEKVWRLPLWDSYRDALDSDIADVKNLSAKPVAGAITAAKFLEYFIKDHQRWAHLDIAGMAFGDTDHAKMKSATGYGIRLLVDFARTIMSI